MGALETGWTMSRDSDRWKQRWSSVLQAIRIVPSPLDEAALLAELATASESRVLGFVNAHAMNSIVADPGFFAALRGADVLLRDGSGMARDAGMNMNGTDFIPKILATFGSRRVALWGTRQPYLDAAAARCRQDLGADVVSLEDGFQDIAHYERAAKASDPELIVLGMGMPKQEEVAAALRATASRPVLIVCGGAIIDFLGGRVCRAPLWVRKLGVEWVYRLLKEPRRLFSRYVVGNPLFLLRTESWRNHAA
jgi:N-acetylglucosaminyldiphosphoundecaprenol N-acetyl-beta-D-mannosaminyltransferase